MILKRVNRCIKFKQPPWLEKWISFNTDKRKEATTDFGKDLFKLMNNAVFGKTMENVRSHMDYKLVDNIVRLEKCMNSPTMKNRHPINDNLIGIENIKSVVKLNKPIYVGMAILDLSKLHMYRYYYDVLKPMYGDKMRLAYTDTDSFVIHIETEDIHEDLKQIEDYMDFSDYPTDHPNYNIANKKVLGKSKHEMNGGITTEFIGLKPKMYVMKVEDGKEQKKQREFQKTLSNKIWVSICINKQHLKQITFSMWSLTALDHTYTNYSALHVLKQDLVTMNIKGITKTIIYLILMDIIK